MTRHQPITRLHENPSAAPEGARVIDAKYVVVRKSGASARTATAPRPQSRARRWLRGFSSALLAAAIAIVAGLLLPPLWMLTIELLAAGS